MSDKLKAMMEAAKPSATNGALYILFSGVILSFGPVYFASHPSTKKTPPLPGPGATYFTGFLAWSSSR
jgi:hypothetical protein